MLTIKQLMDELSALPPHLPVRLVCRYDGPQDEDGPVIEFCDPWDADDVRFEGNHVVIKSE